MLGIKTAALPASLRRTNQRTVISLLLRLGTASRADLAKAAGLSQPTAGKITSELLELGILQPAGSSASEEKANGSSPRLGRPGQLLRLDEDRRRFLAMELGVLQTRLAALPVAVKLQDEWTHRFATPGSPADWVRALTAISAQLPAEGLWGVLISVPGIVDEMSGRVVFSPNLHWLEKVPLAELVRTVWDLPVLLVQEIRALALGHLTAEPVREDFFLVDFGHGVGGAIVSDGKSYSPPTPLSGEIGHSPVAGNRRRCGCGAAGCLETLVSRRGLLDSFSTSAGRTAAPLEWQAMVEHVAEHGLEPWLKETLDATARAIAGALNVLGVHRVIVTGSLTELPGCVLEYLGEGIRAGTMWARFGEVVCQSALRRRTAGLVAVGIDRLVLPAGDGSGARRPELSGSGSGKKALK